MGLKKLPTTVAAIAEIAPAPIVLLAPALIVVILLAPTPAIDVDDVALKTRVKALATKVVVNLLLF